MARIIIQDDDNNTKFIKSTVSGGEMVDESEATVFETEAEATEYGVTEILPGYDWDVVE